MDIRSLIDRTARLDAKTQWRKGAKKNIFLRLGVLASWRLVPAVAVLAGCGDGSPSNVAAPPAAPPARVVSVVPSVTATIGAIGEADRLVGVSTFCIPPAGRDLPRVGGLRDPEVETILALRPDLVFIYRASAAAEGLRRSGIRVVETGQTGALTLEEVFADIRLVGRELGPDADRRAAEIEARLREGIGRVRAAARDLPRRKVLFAVDRDGGSLVVVGRDTYLDELIGIAGGTNVVTGRHYPSWSMEEVLAAAPDVILESHPTTVGPADEWIVPADDAFWKAYPAVPAVRDGRTWRVKSGEVVQPGPTLVKALEAIAGTIHPEAFGRRQEAGRGGVTPPAEGGGRQ